MPAAYVLLKCVGKAVVKNVANLFSFGVGGSILVDAWDYWRAATCEEERPRQVEAVAALPAAELRAEVARIVREEAAGLSPEQQARVAAYLGQVPATVRRTLRRPSDPSGTTTAAGTVFRKPDDLAPLLPAGLPRFKAGDRPLPGVDWELVELLGVGGFGEVWKARNPHFDGRPPVALKFCLDPAAKERLLKHEAKIISQVMQQGKHEGIVSLLHTYLSADPPCLEYEYVEGGDLAGVIQGRRGGLTAANAAHVVRRLAEIVGFAHRMNPPVVHRDLKPANILATPGPGGKWRLRITDFGIGGLAIQQAVAQSHRSSNHGEFLTAAVRGSYTPLYGSPQQMRGEDPDPRDDVYALGVIWHQLLTGDLTTGRPGGDAWKRRLTERGMTPVLLSLLASCFEDRREDRPGNGVDLIEKLSRALALTQEKAPSARYRMAIPLPEVLPVEGPPAVPQALATPPQAPKEKPTGSSRRVKRKPKRDGKGAGPLRRSWLWIGGLAVLLFLALGVGYVVIGHLRYTEGRRYTEGITNDLKQLGLGTHSYTDANNDYLPPAAIADKNSKPLLSWRVLLLPYMGEDSLYNEFHLDEPWDSDHNKKLLEKMPRIFAPPDSQAFKDHETHYQAIVGKDTVFDGTKVTLASISAADGTSNTILFVEAKKAVPWTKPEDISLDDGKLLPKLGGLSEGGFLATLCDGSVRKFPLTMKEETLRIWATRNNGQERTDPDK